MPKKRPIETYRPRPRKIAKPGAFVAWIVATDLPAPDHSAGPSGYAWEVWHDGGGEPADFDAAPNENPDSDENEGYVAAAARVVESLPDGSSVHIWTLSDYIVQAIKQWLPKWRENGFRRSGGKTVMEAEAARVLAKLGLNAIIPANIEN